jgi:hypothetical protein
MIRSHCISTVMENQKEKRNTYDMKPVENKKTIKSGKNKHVSAIIPGTGKSRIIDGIIESLDIFLQQKINTAQTVKDNNETNTGISENGV